MSVWVSIGLRWRGIGFSGGLFPELRLGFLAVGWCRGVLAERLADWRAQTRAALDALGVRV